MQKQTLVELGNLFLALSDKTRLRLLALMAGGEVSVGYLADALGESQPKISRHLAYLRTAGLVSTRRDGKRVYYCIEPAGDAAVATVMDATLKSISADDCTHKARPERSDSDVYQPDTHESNISVEPYIGDWTPAEMEIYLL